MLPQIKHAPINWEDGMLVSAREQLDQENAWRDRIRDVTAIKTRSWEHGLLYGGLPQESSFELSVELDKISLINCRAITRGGFRVELIKGQDDPVILRKENTEIKSSQGEENIFFIVLIVNSFKREPSGTPRLQENDTRIPYTKDSFLLKAISKKDWNASGSTLFAHLPVGKVTVREGQLYQLEGYIPPCSSMSAHPKLISLSEDITKQLDLILDKGIHLSKKIKRSPNTGNISRGLDLYVRQSISAVSNRIDGIKLMGPEWSPLEFSLRIMECCRQIDNALRLLPSRDKIITWIENKHPHTMQTGRLNEALGLTLSGYNHNDPAKTLAACLNSIQTIATSIKLLDTMDAFLPTDQRNSFNIN